MTGKKIMIVFEICTLLVILDWIHETVWKVNREGTLSDCWLCDDNWTIEVTFLDRNPSGTLLLSPDQDQI